MKPNFPRILATTAICLAAGTWAYSQPAAGAGAGTDEQAYLSEGYTRITLDTVEREELSKVLAPFLNSPNEIAVEHLQNRCPDNGTHTWLYAGGEDCKFKKIGVIKVSDVRELAKADCYLYDERDTLDYFMILRLSLVDYSIRIRISPVRYDNISLESNTGSAYVYSGYFHRILMHVIDKHYLLDTRS